MPRTYAESREPGHFKNRAGWTLRSVRSEVEKKLDRIMTNEQVDGTVLVTKEVKVFLFWKSQRFNESKILWNFID